jgi:hypothetical protein
MIGMRADVAPRRSSKVTATSDRPRRTPCVAGGKGGNMDLATVSPIAR